MRRTADSVDALPPHRVLASSGELCLQSAAPGVVDDCESIQFVAGLAVEPGGRHLLLSYGVTDCSARLRGTDWTGARARHAALRRWQVVKIPTEFSFLTRIVRGTCPMLGGVLACSLDPHLRHPTLGATDRLAR